MLLALAVSFETHAASGAAGDKSQSAIDFRIRVPKVLRMVFVDRKPLLEVAQGGRTVTVERAATLQITCNVRHYELRFTLHDPAVESVEVEGLGRPLVVRGDGAAVHVPVLGPGDRRATRTLTYRVRYAHDVPPGPRPVPVSISLAGI